MGTKLKHLKDAEELNIHSMPCKIHADMEIDVDRFFKPTGDSETELTASFRGYPLNGTTVELPQSYRGLVFNMCKDSSQEVKNYNCVGQFKKLTYWNWNKIPSKSDPLLNAMDWLSLSNSIHDPVDA